MSWTERYVRADAAGSGNGTTDTNSGANGAWTFAEGITNEAAGMRLNMKAGTYANTTNARTLAAVGTTIARIWWRGFKGTAGDQDTNNLAVPGTDIPSITFTTAGLTVSGVHHILSNIDVTGAKTAGTAQAILSGADSDYYRCRFANTNTGATCPAVQVVGICTMVGCTFSAASTTTTNIVQSLANGQILVLGCRFFGGGNVGYSMTTATGVTIHSCVFDSIPGDAINITTGGANIIGNIIYAPTGNGVNVTGTPANLIVVANNIFSTVNQAAKAAINNSSGTNTGFIIPISNGYWNCTATRSGLTEDFNIYDNATLASDPLVSPGTGNFALNPVARNIGFPGLFENTSVYQGYLDLGAAQAGGGLLVNPARRGRKQ